MLTSRRNFLKRAAAVAAVAAVPMPALASGGVVPAVDGVLFIGESSSEYFILPAYTALRVRCWGAGGSGAGNVEAVT